MLMMDVVSHVRLASDDPLGGNGLLSWERITEILRAAGEIGPGQRLRRVRIDESGISFGVEDV